MSVIVTGIARGIGLAITTSLLEKGSVGVVGIARKENETIKQLQAKFGDKFTVIYGDVTEPSTNEKAISEALSKYKSLVGVVCNAGVTDPAVKLENMSAHIQETEKLFKVNVIAPFDLASQSIPHLRQSGNNGFGRFLIISSGASSAGYPGLSAYGASKAAINSLAKSIKNEEPKIIPMAFRPGVVVTDMVQGIIDDGNKHGFDISKFSEAQKTGNKPETIGKIVATLILDAPESLAGEYFSYDDERVKAVVKN